MFLINFLIIAAPDTADVLPKLTPLKDQIVLEGQPAQFKTQVTPAKVKPTIQWYREGALIPQSPDFQVRYLDYIILLIKANFILYYIQERGFCDLISLRFHNLKNKEVLKLFH